MDDITDSIGQLSTNAREWKPGGTYGSPAPATPLHHTDPSLSPSFQPTHHQGGSPSQTLTGQQMGSYAQSSLHHTPPGRNQVPSQTEDTQQWQLQPRNEWNQEPNVGGEFVPGTGWSGSAGQNATHNQSGWNAPESSHGASEEHKNQWQQPKEGPSTLPSGPAPAPPVRSLHNLGLTDGLWQYYRDISLQNTRQLDPSDPRHKAIPPTYVNPFPLDDNINGTRSSFGYPTSIFKVMSRDDGHLYCLRRFDNVRSVSYKIAAATTERWATARNLKTGASVAEHPGIVRFQRMFLSNRAVFFIHDYVPGSRTLRERFLDVNAGGGMPLPEPVIWSCITQLVAAIRAVHAANLACRTLQLNHILCSTPNWSWTEGDMSRLRLRINCVGIADALEFEARKGLAELQREDMIDLGYVIVSLTTGNEITRRNCDLRRLDVYMGQNFSRSLHSLAMSLIARNTNPPSISDVSNAVASRVFDELDSCYTMVDRSDAALGSEYESGRALRLLLKIGFVNERPEFAMNRRWSESGDCYVLKLFRDFVFHQADAAGRPVMDLGHVVSALNKLDAGDEEKIVLASRDGKSMLVVSYADVARCLDTAFSELCAGSVTRYGP